MKKSSATPRTTKTLTLAACPGCIPRGGDVVVSPQRAKELGMWGCVYRVTLQLPGKLGVPLVYTGSRGFGPNTKTKSGEPTAASRAWEHYTSSSDDVNAKLATGVYLVTWTILAYGKTKEQCLAIEASMIAQSVKQYGTSKVLNRAQVGGGKLTSYRSKYSKKRPPTGGTRVCG